MSSDYPYVWHWRGSWWRPIYRKGQRCRVVIRSRRMNSALIQFEDGWWTIASRNAIRKAP